MSEPPKDAAIDTVNLLIHYSFDLGGYTAEKLVNRWCAYYSPLWVRSAVIEALYQGRYKAISVDQILRLWQRRNHPLYHFNMEFERIVCSTLPRRLTPQMVGRSVAISPAISPAMEGDRTLEKARGMTETGAIDPSGAIADQRSENGAKPLTEETPTELAGKISDSAAGKHSEEPIEEYLEEPEEPIEEPIEEYPEEASWIRPVDSDLAEEVVATTEPLPDLPPPVVNPAPNSQANSSKAIPYTIAPELLPDSTQAAELGDRELSDLPLFSELDQLDSPLWARRQTMQQPIDQFVPAPEASGFYTRLKAVARNSDRDSPPNPEEPYTQPFEPQDQDHQKN